LKSTRSSQIVGTKCKEITTISSKDEMEQWPFKKAKGKQLGKYCREATMKIGSVNFCEKYVSTG